MRQSCRSLSRSRPRGAVIALASLAVLGAIAVPPASAQRPDGGARAASAAACQAAGLVIWLDTQSNGAAGSFYYTLNFTNLSGHSCTLRGYPGVSGVDVNGAQQGAAATRDPGTPVRTVTLASGRTATALLRIVDTGVLTAASCRPATLAGLRVFPPNQIAAKLIPYPFSGCSARGATYLSIRAVRSRGGFGVP